MTSRPLPLPAVLLVSLLALGPAALDGCAVLSPSKGAVLGPSKDAAAPSAPSLPKGHPVPGSPGTVSRQAMAYQAFLRGQMLAQEGKAREAVSAFEEASLLDASSEEILDALANQAAAVRDLDRALSAARRKVDLFPGPASHRLLGEVLAEKGDFAGAAAQYRLAIELAPDQPQPYLFLAGACERMGDLAGTQAVLEKMGAIEGQAAASHYYLGRLFSTGDRMEKAVEEFLLAAAADPSYSSAVERQAGTFLEQRGGDKAARLLSAYLAKKPEDKGARLLYARVLAGEGRAEEAAREVQTVLDAEPAHPEALSLAAGLRARAGNLEGALALLEKARAAAPGDLDLWLQTGALLKKAGRKEEALAVYREASALFPERFEPLGNAAILLEDLGRPGEALAAARTAVSRDPARASSRVFLSQLLADRKETAEAEQVLQEGLKRDPAEGLILYQMGVLYEQTDRWPQAEAAMTKILAADPHHYEAMNFLGYSWADRGIRLAEAEKMVGDALSLAPEEGHIIDSMGWVYYRQGRYQESLVHLLKAAEKMPEDATVLEHVGDCYDKLGDRAKSLEYWGRALARDAGNARLSGKIRGAGGTVAP
jgi:tetratricopeptide (TPR) repeat protein